MAELHKFNIQLSRRRLTAPGLLIFLASLWRFNKNIASGIPVLASRLADDLSEIAPLHAHKVAAHILDAAVDEFGLGNNRSHWRLFFDFAKHFKFSPQEVMDPAHAAKSAVNLGDKLFGWYRQKPVAYAIGVHLASEMSSLQEFRGWRTAFLRLPEYGLRERSPSFAYIRSHFNVEGSHVRKSQQALRLYLHWRPREAQQVLSGAESYLNKYASMFSELIQKCHINGNMSHAALAGRQRRPTFRSSCSNSL